MEVAGRHHLEKPSPSPPRVELALRTAPQPRRLPWGPRHGVRGMGLRPGPPGHGVSLGRIGADRSPAGAQGDRSQGGRVRPGGGRHPQGDSPSHTRRGIGGEIPGDGGRHPDGGRSFPVETARPGFHGRRSPPRCGTRTHRERATPCAGTNSPGEKRACPLSVLTLRPPLGGRGSRAWTAPPSPWAALWSRYVLGLWVAERRAGAISGRPRLPGRVGSCSRVPFLT